MNARNECRVLVGRIRGLTSGYSHYLQSGRQRENRHMAFANSRLVSIFSSDLCVR